MALLSTLKQAGKDFVEDEAMTRAAAVAYYAALSLAPMVLLFIAITGFLGQQTQQDMIETVNRTVGEQAGQAIQNVADQGKNETSKATWSMVISIVMLLFSASLVVAALQQGLNRVWDIKPAPGEGIVGWIRKRVLSMSMVLVIAFLLLISMVATTVVSSVVSSDGWLWNLVTLAVSAAVFVLLFAAMFRVLPDAKIAWADVWFGAITTAVLFAIGKYLIGIYLGTKSYEDSYGAAGSMIGMLAWVYYSALILYFGAELTQVTARQKGRLIRPDSHAVWDERGKHTPDAPPADAARA